MAQGQFQLPVSAKGWVSPESTLPTVYWPKPLKLKRRPEPSSAWAGASARVPSRAVNSEANFENSARMVGSGYLTSAITRTLASTSEASMYPTMLGLAEISFFTAAPSPPSCGGWPLPVNMMRDQ